MTQEHLPPAATGPFVIEPVDGGTQLTGRLTLPRDHPGESDRVEIFRDSAGEWRWHRVAPNNRLVAGSGEGYVELRDCQEVAVRVNRQPYILVMHPASDTETDTSGAEAGTS